MFGGGSFGTAMATALARQKQSLEVVMLMRDPYVCRDINHTHINARYLQVTACVLCEVQGPGEHAEQRKWQAGLLRGRKQMKPCGLVHELLNAACGSCTRNPCRLSEGVRLGLCNRTALPAIMQAIPRAALAHAACGQACGCAKKEFLRSVQHSAAEQEDCVWTGPCRSPS